jgi:hypothetical protein
MFWTGFFAGFASCVGLVICDHLLAGFRSERRARASFMATLSEDEQKRFRSIEAMGDWQQARSMIENRERPPETRRLVGLGLRAEK